LLSRFFIYATARVLEYGNVLCLRAFLSLHNIELYALAFFQVSELLLIKQFSLPHISILYVNLFQESSLVIVPWMITLF